MLVPVLSSSTARNICCSRASRPTTKGVKTTVITSLSPNLATRCWPFPSRRSRSLLEQRLKCPINSEVGTLVNIEFQSNFLTQSLRLNEEAQAVKSRKEWTSARKLYSTIMPQKAYGPRLEITLQNPTLAQLLLAYQEMAALGQVMTELFNMLKALYQCNLIPLEKLRCSPLQTVLTETVCLFPEKFTDSIANYFYFMLDHVSKGKFLPFLTQTLLT